MGRNLECDRDNERPAAAATQSTAVIRLLSRRHFGEEEAEEKEEEEGRTARRHVRFQLSVAASDRRRRAHQLDYQEWSEH